MKLLNSEGVEQTYLDFGIVEAGKTKKYEYTLVNDLACEVVNIQVSVGRKEISVVSAPEKLKANESASLVFTWSPPVTVKQGLKSTIVVKGVELWS